MKTPDFPKATSMYPIEPLYIDGLEPKKAHEDDAGFDLRAAHPAIIPAGERRQISVGVAIAIPVGYVGLFCPRSGLALKHGITILNTPSVIDPGYRGTLTIVLLNTDRQHAFEVETGDRIAQLLILQNSNFKLVQSKNALDETDRGSGGFGSTGINNVTPLNPHSKRVDL